MDETEVEMGTCRNCGRQSYRCKSCGNVFCACDWEERKPLMQNVNGSIGSTIAVQKSGVHYTNSCPKCGGLGEH